MPEESMEESSQGTDHSKDPCKRYQAIVTSPNVRGDDGGTTHEVISKWFGRHDAILAWGCFNAFKLRSHPERSATHIFCMVAKPRCGGAKLKPKHMLEIDLMALIPLGLVPSELKEDLDLMNADYAKRDRQDRVVTYMTVECEGYFRIRQLLWDEQELLTMREDENWKNIMWNITGVESKYRMVGSNPVAK
ncbi:hypothetical protein PILCRDRAFT_7177 [Piloderma croceum F 1598]|uniref:Uncharacterized protein n=1 Tax=Piloderma croceum (strain F 1598) TaxID=765440 RepID=A0A0C3C0X3_PILCF|nr:hypothetical protein PILCRDRAFT_7177 [Piloderma croceum F 1598]